MNLAEAVRGSAGLTLRAVPERESAIIEYRVILVGLVRRAQAEGIAAGCPPPPMLAITFSRLVSAISL